MADMEMIVCTESAHCLQLHHITTPVREHHSPPRVCSVSTHVQDEDRRKGYFAGTIQWGLPLW